MLVRVLFFLFLRLEPPNARTQFNARAQSKARTQATNLLGSAHVALQEANPCALDAQLAMTHPMKHEGRAHPADKPYDATVAIATQEAIWL